MKLIRMDSDYYWFYLLASIVIPPLFIMNLILLFVQIIPKIIKQKNEIKNYIKDYDLQKNKIEITKPKIKSLKFNFNIYLQSSDFFYQITTDTLKYETTIEELKNSYAYVDYEEKQQILIRLQFLKDSYSKKESKNLKNFFYKYLSNYSYCKIDLLILKHYLIKLDKLTPEEQRLNETQELITILDKILMKKEKKKKKNDT